MSLLILPLLVLLATCTTGDHYIQQLADKVWQYSTTHPEGFTITIPQLTPLTSGLAVGYSLETPSTGQESLPTVIEHSLNHSQIIGGWLDPTTQIYYFDSIKIFAEDQHAQAYQFAKDNHQIAYYDLSTGTTHYIEY